MLMIIVSSSLTSTSTSSWETPRSTAPCSRARTESLVSLRGLSSCAPSSVSAVRSVMGSPPRSPRPRCFLELHGDAPDRVVLAQRVPFPVVGHEDARQIGMALEDDPEQVVDLALHRLGPREQLEEGRQCRLPLRDLGPHADPLAFLHVEEVDDDLEAFGADADRQRPVDGEQVVDCGHVRAEGVAVVAQRSDYLDVLLTVHVHDEL